MECRYCRAWNGEEEHRCTRCGRRLRLANARPAPETLPIQTATAPALLEMSEPVSRRVAVSPEPAEPPESPRPVYQRTLFREMPQVLPTLPDADVRRTARHRSTRSGRRSYEGQGAFNFDATAGVVDSGVIYCDSPVALPVHRAMAAALDMSLVIAALGVFMLTFHFAGGAVVLNKQTAPFFAGVAGLLGVLYRFLFCLAGGDTAGYRWTQLRLLNFDGQAPSREQRLYRLAASFLSVFSAGLGLMWALVDEESLTWHDHISKTFLTPYEYGDEE